MYRDLLTSVLVNGCELAYYSLVGIEIAYRLVRKLINSCFSVIIMMFGLVELKLGMECFRVKGLYTFSSFSCEFYIIIFWDHA